MSLCGCQYCSGLPPYKALFIIAEKHGCTTSFLLSLPAKDEVHESGQLKANWLDANGCKTMCHWYCFGPTLLQQQASYQLVMLPVDQQPPDQVMLRPDEQTPDIAESWLPCLMLSSTAHASTGLSRVPHHVSGLYVVSMMYSST